MRFRFLHAADLHLDTPFEGVSRTNPVLAEQLRDASLKAFDTLVDVAISRDVTFVVLAGDIYDGEERGVRAQLRFRRGLATLSDNGIRCFVAHGNHDPVKTGWTAIGTGWPEMVTVFGHREVQSVSVEVAGEQVATVHGISYGRREETDNLALGFSRCGGEGLRVGVLHCNLGSNSDHGRYAPCTVDDLVGIGIDYWALGHIHSRQVIRSGDPWIVYPGNTQGRSTKHTERGAKGAYLAEVEDREVRSLDFVPLDSVRFEHVVIDIVDIGDISSLEQRLVDAASAVQREAGDCSVILQALLHGSGPLHAEVAKEGRLEEILHAVRDATESGGAELWWESVRDGTKPNFDLESVRARGDFSGELVDLASELARDPDRLASLAGDRVPAVLVRELSGLGVDVVNTADSALVQRAVERALELLGGGGG